MKVLTSSDPLNTQTKLQAKPLEDHMKRWQQTKFLNNSYFLVNKDEVKHGPSQHRNFSTIESPGSPTCQSTHIELLMTPSDFSHLL